MPTSTTKQPEAGTTEYRAPERRTSTSLELEAILGAIIRHAPALRSAGVRELAYDLVRVSLDPPEPPAPPPPAHQDVVPVSDPLYDPITHGRTDGKVPGLRKTWEDDE